MLTVRGVARWDLAKMFMQFTEVSPESLTSFSPLVLEF